MKQQVKDIKASLSKRFFHNYIHSQRDSPTDYFFSPLIQSRAFFKKKQKSWLLEDGKTSRGSGGVNVAQPQLLWAQVRLFFFLEQIKPQVNREERLIATVSTSEWTISPPRDTQHTQLIPPSSSLSPPLHIHCSLSLFLTRSVGPPHQLWLRLDKQVCFCFFLF